MNTSAISKSNIQPKTPEIEQMIQNTKSLILATIDENGNPLSSYAPFVLVEGRFYILVSYMAKHTKNLRDQKIVSVMLIEDESSTKQIYARDRLTIDCNVHLVELKSEKWQKGIEHLISRHEKIVEMLSELNDFVLFELLPQKGNYVNGFGSAYTVNPDLTVHEHVKGAHGNGEDSSIHK